MLRKATKNVQREGKGSDGSKKWGRGGLWATLDGVGGGLPALKGGDLHLGPSPPRCAPIGVKAPFYADWGHTW